MWLFPDLELRILGEHTEDELSGICKYFKHNEGMLAIRMPFAFRAQDWRTSANPLKS